MRAVLRMARRSVRRHPLRSAVVVALVLLPVAVLVGVLSAMAGNDLVSERSFVVVYGAAEAVSWDGFSRDGVPIGPVSSDPPVPGEVSGPTGLEGVLPSGTETWRGTSGTVARARPDGTAELLGWVDDDGRADSRRSRGLVAGRWPSAAGEVAVAVDGPGVEVGSTLQVGLPATELRVVGTWGQADDPFGGTVLVTAPGSFPDASAPIWASSGLTGPSSWTAVRGVPAEELTRLGEQLGWQVRPGIRPQWQVVGVSLFGFTWCGLVAASALAIGARRRRRELGLLATNGADPRQLRTAVAAEGIVLGAVGATGGLLLGLAGAAAWARWAPDLTGRDWPSRWYVTPVVLVAPLLGWASAALAGALAGRGVARQTTVDLLAGRAPRAATAPRWLKAGTLATGVSIAAGLVAGDTSETGSTAAAVVAVAAGVVALVTLPVGLIALLPAAVSGRGVAVRTAARDLHRFGARTAAAVGAIAITLSGATFAGVLHQQRAEEAEQVSAAVVDAPTHATVHAEITTLRQTIVGDRLVYGDLPDALAAQLVSEARAHDLRAGVVRRLNGAGVRACASNARDLAGELGGPDLVGEDGCLDAAVAVVPDELVAQLPDHLRDVLQAGRAALFHPGVSQEVRDARLELDGATLDVPFEDVSAVSTAAVPDVSTFDMPIFLFTGGATVSALVPRSLESSLPADRLVDVVLTMAPASMGLAEGRAAAEWLDGLVPEELQVNRYDVVWTDPGIPTPVVLGVGAGIALVCLIILGLSLVLVRLESRQEESVLRTQGATRAVVARVHGARAALATVTAAVPAVALSLLFLDVVTDAVRWPHPVTLVVLLVGMPVAAGLVFAAAGARVPRRDASVV